MNNGLGRIKPEVLDERNKNFPVRALLPKKAAPPYKYWDDNDIFLNQGDTPRCVGFAWAQYINDGPIKHKKKLTAVDAGMIYLLAQDLDEFPGNDYDGSSTLGGAKACQQYGYITEYHWALTLQDVIDTVLHLGPMVVGTDWYNDMFFVDDKGFIHPTGGLAGGHEWEITGINVKDKKLRGKSSWGEDELDGGRFWITFDDFEILRMAKGECCIATEKK